MSRKLRFLPSPLSTVEITQRTFQGRALLRPSKRFNDLVVGCLARARELSGCRLHAVAMMSNHFHLLATFETVAQQTAFMRHFKTNLAKEAGKLHGWSGSVFAGRYKSISVSDEPAAQEARLRYVLSQGAKEGLVASPREWPGVHSAGALLEGEPLYGVWIDRTKLYAARRKDPSRRESEFATVERLDLAPLPAWEGSSRAQRRELAARMISEIEDATRAMHAAAGTRPAGAAAVLRRHPHTRLPLRARTAPPRVHAVTRQARERWHEAYRLFESAYREAADRLRDARALVDHQNRRLRFPRNCWPPGLPFVDPAVV